MIVAGLVAAAASIKRIRQRPFTGSAGWRNCKADVLVLGAGMVGVGAALHLQQRGRDVILVDRHELRRRRDQFWQCRTDRMRVGFPLYVSPRFRPDLAYAINRAPQVRYQLSDLPVFLPWLARYFLASSPERALHSAMAELPLIRRSLIEHEALIAEAGVPELLRRTGWLKLFRLERRWPTPCATSIAPGSMASKAKFSTARRSRRANRI